MGFVWTPFALVHLVLDAGTLLWFGLVLGLAFWRLGGFARCSARDAVLALATAAFFSLVPLAAGATMLPSLAVFFLTARMMWTIATVAVPAGLLALAWRRRAWAWAAPAVLLLGLKYYGEVIEPNRLEVERVVVPMPGLRAPLKLAHLSDLQTDRFDGLHSAVSAELKAYSPDFLFFTGDLVNHPALEPHAAAWMKSLPRRGDAFLVRGDIDGAVDLAAFSAASGFEDLTGKERVVLWQGTRLGLAGIDAAQAFDPAAIEEKGRALAVRKASPRLLLSHRPDALKAAGKAGFDLLAAGHTHGGQVVIPFYGPPVTLSRVPRRIAAGGLHKEEGLWVLQSRGLGVEGHIAPRVRLFCRPHLLLAELVPLDPAPL